MARRNWRLMAVLTGGVAVSLVLAACAGFWNTGPKLGTLVVGPVVVTGPDGYVRISVTDMREGGLAAIQLGIVGDEAITFSDIDPVSVAIEGKNEFVVLAQDFATNPGKGTLLAATPGTAVVAGEILKLVFKITGPNPTLTVAKSKVTLASDSNAIISVWNLSAKAY